MFNQSIFFGVTFLTVTHISPIFITGPIKTHPNISILDKEIFLKINSLYIDYLIYIINYADYLMLTVHVFILNSNIDTNFSVI